ncbi:MAG: NAD-dependent deacylase [Hyphomicrobiaceae bacterium]|nr:NAD-dependent deacylase [Hyphomicrobiaceae bacterium]
MDRFESIVVLTGAGLSAESGLATFRDQGGIWAKYDYREVATPEGFRQNPALVREFYNLRRNGALAARPNAAHFALARLEAEHPGDVLIITQNVDTLHEAAGSTRLIHMHGSFAQQLCVRCGERSPWTTDLTAELACPGCGKRNGLRPDVVWFGEMPYALEAIAEAIAASDLFVAIGTSGQVYPAAGFVALASQAGAHTVELNLEASDVSGAFAEHIHGPATAVVPAYVERLIGVFR